MNKLKRVAVSSACKQWTIGIGSLITIVYLWRRPDNWLHAQFWAEDGQVWFRQAYDYGLAAFAIPIVGYFQTLSRLVAALAQLVPLYYAPTLMNSVALAIQLLPAWFLLSPRLSNVVPHTWLRWLLAFGYVLLPNTAEIYGNITNTQWHLALLAFLILLAQPARTTVGHMADYAVLILSGLSGPFAFFLLVISLWKYWLAKSKLDLRYSMVLAATAAVQLSALLQYHRYVAANSEQWFLPIVLFIKQIMWGMILGPQFAKWLLVVAPGHNIIMWGSGVIVLTLLLNAGWHGPMALRYFMTYAAMIYVVSVIFPTVHATNVSTWEVMYAASSGMRYWLIPMCLLMTVLLWSLAARNSMTIRVLAVCVLLWWPIGLVSSYQHRSLAPHDYVKFVQRFEAAAPGEDVRIPINPGGWYLHLTK